MNQLKCRHMLSGRVTYKLCGHGYNCVQCPYDQMIEDTAFTPRLSAPACDHASGFDVARDYYYHHRHAWARVEYGGRVRIGVDDFATRMLGPLDAIELPKLGETVQTKSAPSRAARRQPPRRGPEPHRRQSAGGQSQDRHRAEATHQAIPTAMAG